MKRFYESRFIVEQIDEGSFIKSSKDYIYLNVTIKDVKGESHLNYYPFNIFVIKGGEIGIVNQDYFRFECLIWKLYKKENYKFLSFIKNKEVKNKVKKSFEDYSAERDLFYILRKSASFNNVLKKYWHTNDISNLYARYK